MPARSVREPKADVAVDEGVVQMKLLEELDAAEGFATFVSTFPPWGAGPRRIITIPTTRRSTC